ncbi:ribonuclease 3-like protein 2 isoform X1 [Salvia splendens]|uniref:ribonuclease 3-like protein 2 isoform X1 n=1 Tax=Salvia splendens TaxID=180675 RepID=UPI001C268246|nr:ribonuclease 3-like protein 2 isoform X1 [Salvia splendens]XP_042008830.1 ribonuclease 3-like protein 2 isoform X1 [Salvia splendens]
MEAMDMDEVEEISDIEASVGAVENLLGYCFKQKKLLEEALTHSSCADSPSASYQRLEFVGVAALGLAVANFVYLYYPGLDPGKLSLLRSANTSTEKLARVAVRHRLYKYVRHNAAVLDERDTIFDHINMDGEIEEAKQKLHEPHSNPNYKIIKEACVANQKRFTCSVEIDLSMASLLMEGKEKPRVREAESSAASAMLFGLKNSRLYMIIMS